MRYLLFLPVLLWATVTACAAPEPVIDGVSAPQWTACTGWVNPPPAAYKVANEGGSLVFTAEGAGREMPWIINLDKLGLSGDQRYLLLRYKARGMSTNPGVYFLHGEEGTRGGLAYALADDVKPDDQWHVLAVDLLALDPLEVTHNLAVKVAVDNSGSARLEISKLWFSNDLPGDAQLARTPARRPEAAATLDWASAKPVPQQGWTTAPVSDFSATPEGSVMAFTVRGAQKGMRWLVALPPSVDLAKTPYVSVRYKASGALASGTYAIWLGDRESGSGGNSVIALPASDLKVDGAWHTVSVKLQKVFTATHLAVGLDCSGDEASLTLDTVGFSSRPPRWSLAQVLPYEYASMRWPGGTGPVTITGGSGSPFLAKRLGLSD
ncbi:MAG: hypothetical protein ACM3VW_04620, partial [Bacteroidota bacterium]